MAAASKRSRSDVFHSAAAAINSVPLYNLSDAHDFIVPNEICTSALGLFHCLTTKRLINMPFSALYLKSLKDGWEEILTRERRSLRPNSNSIEKCFILNRLLAEYSKDSDDFIRRVRNLYDEIRMRMSNSIPSSWNQANLYQWVQAWRELQCKRRLFYISHDEAGQLHNLLFLQRAYVDHLSHEKTITTEVFRHLLISTPAKPRHIDQRNGLIELLRHSLIIVAQPTGPDCVAATKYEKTGQKHTARLHTRIICLLHPDVIKDHLKLSNIGVALHLLHDPPDKKGEDQPELEWRRQELISAEGVSHSFLYAELSSLQLSRFDCRNNHLVYNSNLCRLQFRISINTSDSVIKEELKFESQPFGLCSHPQYFPELVAQVIIVEIEQMMKNADSVIQPDILTNFIGLYYARVSGVELKSGTRQFIHNVLQKDTEKQRPNVSSIDVYKDILGKLISQIDFLVDHPFMAMMYHDGLFIGLADSRADEQLSGSQERPHICVRFNSLQDYPSTQSATVRYIVHDGQLTKATFQMRAFADEMCGFVYEATQERAAQTRILSMVPGRTYQDFKLYFDYELYRLGKMVPDENRGYKPMIPVLWKLMRRDDINQLQPTTINSSPTVRSHIEVTISAFPSVTNNPITGLSDQQNARDNVSSNPNTDYIDFDSLLQRNYD